jgi:hypothetical protein
MYIVFKPVFSTVGIDNLANHVTGILAIDIASTKLEQIAIVSCRNSAEACHIARKEYGIDANTKLFAWDKRLETNQEPIK